MIQAHTEDIKKQIEENDRLTEADKTKSNIYKLLKDKYSLPNELKRGGGDVDKESIK